MRGFYGNFSFIILKFGDFLDFIVNFREIIKNRLLILFNNKKNKLILMNLSSYFSLLDFLEFVLIF